MSDDKYTVRKQLLHFILVTFVISWIAMWYFNTHGGIAKAGIAIVFGMWVPGIVSLLYRWSRGIGFDDVGFKRGAPTFWLCALLVPFLVAALAYNLSWSLGVSEFVKVISPLRLIFKVYPVIFAVGFIAALGEELGWRGFLIPKIYKAEFKYPLIISSLVWAIWHFPLIIWGGYATSPLPLVSLVLFTLTILLAGAFVGWLRMISGSVWVATAFHAAHNLFLQTAFEHFNKPGPQSPYFGGEAGLFPIASYVIVLAAGYAVLRRLKLWKPVGRE